MQMPLKIFVEIRCREYPACASETQKVLRLISVSGDCTWVAGFALPCHTMDIFLASIIVLI